MNTSHEITVLRMIVCAIEETVGRRLAGEEPEPFDTLVAQYGKGVDVTPEMARPLMMKPLCEVFEIQFAASSTDTELKQGDAITKWLFGLLDIAILGHGKKESTTDVSDTSRPSSAT